MQGIKEEDLQYIYPQKNEKKGVIMDIQTFEALIEMLEDYEDTEGISMTIKKWYLLTAEKDERTADKSEHSGGLMICVMDACFDGE